MTFGRTLFRARDGGSPCVAKDLEINMYQGKMNTRTKLFESMNWFKNGIETTPRNVITRTKIFESNLRIANNMSGSQAIKCVRTHIYRC